MSNDLQSWLPDCRTHCHLQLLLQPHALIPLCAVRALQTMQPLDSSALDHVTGNEQWHMAQTNILYAFIHLSPVSASTCKMHQKSQGEQRDRGPAVVHIISEHASSPVLALSLVIVLQVLLGAALPFWILH